VVSGHLGEVFVQYGAATEILVHEVAYHPRRVRRHCEKLLFIGDGSVVEAMASCRRLVVMAVWWGDGVMQEVGCDGCVVGRRRHAGVGWFGIGCVVLCCVVLCFDACVVLCCVVLCCVVLCCVVLCCVALRCVLAMQCNVLSMVLVALCSYLLCFIALRCVGKGNNQTGCRFGSLSLKG